MYIAISKKNPTQYHSFYWTKDNKLMVCDSEVNPDEWDIVEVFESKQMDTQSELEEKLSDAIDINDNITDDERVLIMNMFKKQIETNYKTL